MRVIQVIPKFSTRYWAGAEAAIAGVAPALLALGIELEVLTIQLPGDLPSERLFGIDVRRYPPSRFRNKDLDARRIGTPAWSSRLLLDIWRRRRGIDLVHLHTHNYQTAATSFVARRAGIPTVLTLHSRYLRDSRRLLAHTPASYDYALTHARCVIAVSDAGADAVLASGTPVHKLAVVPHGVTLDARGGRVAGENFRRQHGISPESIVILQVGRICEVKNQAYSVELLQNLARHTGVDAHLVFAGGVSESAYERSTRNRAAELGISERIVWTGQLPPNSLELGAAYAAADVLALPSLHEAQPLVLGEARAAGLPAFVVSGSGLDYLLENGRFGSVLPRDPQSPATTERLASLIEDSRSGCYADALTAWCQTAQWPRIAESIGAIYGTALGGSR